jgi:hypothetical protein
MKLIADVQISCRISVKWRAAFLFPYICFLNLCIKLELPFNKLSNEFNNWMKIRPKLKRDKKDHLSEPDLAQIDYKIEKMKILKKLRPYQFFNWLRGLTAENLFDYSTCYLIKFKYLN